MQKQSVVILIPIFKNNLCKEEKASLKQAFKIFHPKYTIKFICPDNFCIDPYKKLMPEVPVLCERFKRTYFEGIDGYNELMLSSFFYKRFLNYKYILVYQLDAYVFENKLGYWIDSGYDFIGAPWFNADIERVYQSITSSKIWFVSVLKKILRNRHKHIYVGNGGFSLRKVSSFYFISLIYRFLLPKWQSNEDYFWGIFVTTYFPFFRTPKKSEASLFALEEKAEEQFAQKKSLPFGCHAWDKLNKKFWLQHINIQ